MFRAALLATVLMAGLPSPSGAQSAAPVATLPGEWRMTVAEAGVDGVRPVSVVVDRAALFADLPRLQRAGVVSPQIAAADAAKRPAIHLNHLSLALVARAVRDLYRTRPDIGATRWTVSWTEGGSTPAEMYAFQFDRAHDDALAWDRLAPADFPKAAPGFSTNLRFTLSMSREVGGSIADD